MSIKQAIDYYKQFGNVGAMKHSGAPSGQGEIDFRNDTVPQRRVYITFRKSDGKILSVTYWKLGEEGDIFYRRVAGARPPQRR